MEYFLFLIHGLNHSYLQLNDKLTRQVIILPKMEHHEILGDTDQYLLKLLDPICVIFDSGEYWGAKVEHHVTKKMKISPSLCDQALYFIISRNHLEVIMGVNVDDSLNSDTEKFE